MPIVDDAFTKPRRQPRVRSPAHAVISYASASHSPRPLGRLITISSPICFCHATLMIFGTFAMQHGALISARKIFHIVACKKKHTGLDASLSPSGQPSPHICHDGPLGATPLYHLVPAPPSWTRTHAASSRPTPSPISLIAAIEMPSLNTRFRHDTFRRQPARHGDKIFSSGTRLHALLCAWASLSTQCQRDGAARLQRAEALDCHPRTFQACSRLDAARALIRKKRLSIVDAQLLY